MRIRHFFALLALLACACFAHAQDARLMVLDPQFYLDKYPDLKRAFGPKNLEAAKQHWLNNGIKEGRQSSFSFSLPAYQAKNSDLWDHNIRTYEAVLNHYITLGHKENRDTSPKGTPFDMPLTFDPDFYQRYYADIGRAMGGNFGALVKHWRENGIKDGRLPNREALTEALKLGVDPEYYATRYPDLRNGFKTNAVALVTHYKEHGRNEGRFAIPGAETAFEAGPASSGHGRQYLRKGDWLATDQYLRSASRAYIAVQQSDGNFCVYKVGSAQDSTYPGLNWCSRNTSAPAGQYFTIFQGDGNLCTYAGTGPSDNKGFVTCPSGTRNGDFYLILQDDGNLVMYPGKNPASRTGNADWNVGYYKNPKGSIGQWVVSAANTVANGTVLAANSVANTAVLAANAAAYGVTYAANQTADNTTLLANAVANATVLAANVVARETVNTANKVANTTEKVAVSVGRDVVRTGEIVGTEVVKNGEIVGYAVANVAIEAWNYANANCGFIGRKVFPIDKYFQGARQLTSTMNTYGDSNMRQAAARAEQCFEKIQDGFYCAMPGEIYSLASKAGEIPGNVINLSTRVYREATTDTCRPALYATPAFPAAPAVCGLGKIVVDDAAKAYTCLAAVESAGIVNRMLQSAQGAGQSAGGSGFPNDASCVAMGELALKIAKDRILDAAGTQLAAAARSGRSTTTLMVADKLRSIYKIANNASRFEELQDQIDALPACGGKISAAVDVKAAFYGAEGQPTWAIGNVSVADRIRASIQNGVLVVPGDMNTFFGGDPLPGRPKLVAVQVVYQGKTYNLRQQEGRELRFPGREGTDYIVVQ